MNIYFSARSTLKSSKVDFFPLPTKPTLGHLMVKVIHSLVLGISFFLLNAVSAQPPKPFDHALDQQIEQARLEINRRFISPQYSILYDYAGRDGNNFLPTPDECKTNKPNGLAWWSPIENGAFFNGIYLDGLCNRWKISKKEADAREARKVADGLIRLATVGSVPGFVSRDVASDGKSHHVAGSDDQTGPWFYGMWRYIKSGIPDRTEQEKLIKLMETVGNALEKTNWQLPCDQQGYGYRGNLTDKGCRISVRLVFIYRALYDVTQRKKWMDGYHQRLNEIPEGDSLTRLELCSQGILYETANPEKGNKTENEFWITGISQANLKALVELEQTPGIREKFRQGLNLTAEKAALHLLRYKNFDNNHGLSFNENWRLLDSLWKPQPDIATTLALALQQGREWSKLSPARVYEDKHMREPLWACWVVLLSGNKLLIKQHEVVLKNALMHYNWQQLYTSRFFVVLPAYYEARLNRLF
ncbi:hypothetical protein GO755_03075 [Spirosoma sp. HMF4905]|uniref:Uncharacterized protein n=1 Tax=Spirosoma arboris TaxID=2682092 RepID=A0A7K1S5A2_9BACT|nr:hypothetical protein [Spirosoma arboris]MVM29002.1 hypothetical protein [Spirosoma arboris]